jgi:hypothetical protein
MGRDKKASMTQDPNNSAEKLRMPIPGARERNTLTRRMPGSGGFAAAALPGIPAVGSSMDATTIAEHQREGGGAANQRRTVPADKA